MHLRAVPLTYGNTNIGHEWFRAIKEQYAQARTGALWVLDDSRRNLARTLHRRANTRTRRRIRLRELKRAAGRRRRLAAERARESEERARLRELRRQPCGAKTRAGHPCQRNGLGRGGRCANHGGASTGPKTPEGRQRIAEAQRRRWAARLQDASVTRLTKLARTLHR